MRNAVLFLIGATLFAGAALAKGPGPVVRELGPMVPTPAPSPKSEGRIRMITSLTIQNKPDGDSVITFEATDFARADKKAENQYRILATQFYSLVEPKKKEASALADEIMVKIRDLEEDMLQYVEIVGPPRERQPVTEQQPASRPY
jgi:hypothetical protein